MPITPLFAAIFALMFVFLSSGVIKTRLSEKIGLGLGDSRELEKAVRIQGNFAEYVPLALVLLWFLETISFNSGLVFWLGCVLLASRIAHVIGMQNPDQYMKFRQLGVIGTFLVLVVSSLTLLWWYIPASISLT